MTPPSRRARQSPTPRIDAAVVALALWTAIALAIAPISRHLVGRYLDRIGPTYLQAKNQGVLVAREGFRRSDFLPVYGTSELVHPSAYRASDFFTDFPTGFSILAVAERGTPPLITLQQLASVGSELRHRKVVVLLTPAMFATGGIRWLAMPGNAAQARRVFQGNFSRLQAGELLFGSPIGADLKRRAARRLLAKPEVVEDDPFLRMALEASAIEGWRQTVFNPVLQVLGAWQTSILETADQLRMLGTLLARSDLRATVRRRPRPVDFAALRQSAVLDYAARASGHAFGFLGNRWRDPAHYGALRGTVAESDYADLLDSSPHWADLELLFQLLHELEARALIVSIPYAGEYLDYLGVSAAGRRRFYDRLQALAVRYGLRCVTFEDQEYERFFIRDIYQHPGPVGWVAFDSLFDGFYHETAP